MRKLILASLVLGLTIPATGADARQPRLSANPSAIVAAELAFAQLARTKGQWSAFLATSTKDAMMFVPQPTNAQRWLKKQANPPQAVRWQPHEVWMSCDGSAAVSRGAWQRPGSTGYFITMWQRQKDGGYKWKMDQGDALATPLREPEAIVAHVASCSGRPGPRGAAYRPENPDEIWGESDDGTLRWNVIAPNGGGGRFTMVMSWDGTALRRVLEKAVSEPPASPTPSSG